MAITPADFKIRFPEFDSVDDSRIQLFIDDSVLILNETYWGTKYDLGLYYLTAHYLTVATRMANGNSDDASSSVTGKAVDGTSVTYGSPVINDGSDDFYNASAYGKQYLALRKNLGVPAYVFYSSSY